MNVCFLTHGRYEGRPIRNFVRCRSLAAERSSGALAGAAWLLELSPQSLCARELSGLYVGGAASKLRPLRPAEGAAGCSLRARELVPEVQRGLDNGRALQELLHQAAPRFVKALKRERTKARKSKKS